MTTISGNIVDIINKSIYKGIISINNKGIICSIQPSANVDNVLVLPGFIDSHVHIESSMVTPFQFSLPAVSHGTIGVLADPHEIANILGIKGINFMLENAKNTPLNIFFGIPSCVPATAFDINGYKLTSKDIENLFLSDNFYFLSEMMNYPGVIGNDKEIAEKLKVAKKYNKVIDGHAPGLLGNDLIKYISAGISTDHECYNIDEAIEKIKLGMKVMIREGSAAKNFNNLAPLIDLFPDMVMLCTDDSHPDDLINGHIDLLVRKAIKGGLDLFNVLKAACINPIIHYNLPVGMLQPGDRADFIIIDDFDKLNILSMYINGRCIFSNEKVHLENPAPLKINNFNTNKIGLKDIEIKSRGNNIHIIELVKDEIITKHSVEKSYLIDGFVSQNLENDLLKIVYYNRYRPSDPQVGFVRNFGLKSGAIAQTIAHDSHNIVAIGCDDKDLILAINRIVELKGGIVYQDNDYSIEIPLEIGGIMSNDSIDIIAKKYTQITKLLKNKGCKHTSPLMTLSFIALIVIPEIKIGDLGIFDVKEFKFIDLFTD